MRIFQSPDPDQACAAAVIDNEIERELYLDYQSDKHEPPCSCLALCLANRNNRLVSPGYPAFPLTGLCSRIRDRKYPDLAVYSVCGT